ncbi:MAG TPA: haloacid dehalogenase-like hydrolase [Bryobacteraceae bacterium]|jgi:phosphoserine phosphatase
MAALVVVDLGGTLLRGATVCEVLAARLGRVEEMKRFESLTGQAETAAARSEMARWYTEISRESLIECLSGAQWAPGAIQGVYRLREAGVYVGIASITWGFAVDWFAAQLGVEHVLATELGENGHIEHAWPEDKPAWMERLALRLQVQSENVAAVGDSFGDVAMLQAASLPFYVGSHPPPGTRFLHRPAANVLTLAQECGARCSGQSLRDARRR